MSEHQPSSMRFNREDEPATSDPLVSFLTSYARFSVEEHEKVLRSIYGDDRMPGTESRRRSQMGLRKTKRDRTPQPHGACQECGEPLTWGLRFCSRACWRESLGQGKRDVTDEEMVAEMQAALDELRSFIEESGS